MRLWNVKQRCCVRSGARVGHGGVPDLLEGVAELLLQCLLLLMLARIVPADAGASAEAAAPGCCKRGMTAAVGLLLLWMLFLLLARIAAATAGAATPVCCMRCMAADVGLLFFLWLLLLLLA